MTVVDRYVVVAVLRGVALVTMVLISVGTVFEFMGQLPDVGTAQYSIADAVAFVALRIPRLLLRLLPAAALIGALLGLGNLAVQHELVVMRASGVSHMRLMGSVAAAGAVLMVVMGLLGESVAPSLSVYARDLRAQALLDTEDLASGGASTWLKSGDRIVNLRRQANGIEFGGVYLFELDGEQGLRHIAHADTTDIDQANRWILENYGETVFDGAGGVSASTVRQAVKDYGLSLDLLEFSVIRHDLLDTDGLIRYIAYLQANGLDATAYLIAFWGRMADIVSVLLMAVLALPFVLGGMRSSGTGLRVLIGLLIGLAYYVTAQAFANSGQVFNLDPRMVAWLPTAALLLVNVLAFTRIR